ncbi:MAG: hypothetical protein ACK5K7_06740 [Bacilli bacterium]
MKNTFITYIVRSNEIVELDEFKSNLQHFNVEYEVGFTTPSYSVYIECERNKNIFMNSDLKITNMEIEDINQFKKVVLLVTHQEEFMELLKDEHFINQLYISISNYKYFDEVNNELFNIYQMYSANI